jgi:hypothetical protein
MNSSLVFVSGLAVTCLTSLATVIYMQRPLRRLLEELCGTHERANFCAVFSNITVTLVPTIFAMQYEPDSRAELPCRGVLYAGRRCDHRILRRCIDA